MIGPHFWRKSRAKFLKKDLFFITTPWWLRKLFPGCVWDIKTNEKTIYLSFDDGPHPTITPFVLNELKKYNAKATFFLIGDNVKKFPEIYKQVLEEGHATGNHTMHHISGWKNQDDIYIKDIVAAQKYIPSNLFRPPYGQIKKAQIQQLNNHSKLQFKIIMWSVLAGDWVATISPQKCFDRIKNNVYPGCIIVFHDSEKANERMSYALPQVLKYFTQLGYTFKKIEIKSS